MAETGKKATQTDAAAAAERAEAARAEGAERVEEQQEDEEVAAARRERESEQASQLKSVPDGALPPTERTKRNGDTSYQRDWLIANAQPVLGHDAHVVVGALHGDDREYLTVAEATKQIETWLATPVISDPNEA